MRRLSATIGRLPRTAPMGLALFLVLACLNCRQDQPDLEAGKKQLEEIRRIVATDAADKEIDKLLADYDVNRLGISPKDLDRLRQQGHQARLKALLVDIDLAERDVSRKVDELARLAKEWNEPLDEHSIKLGKKTIPATAENLAKRVRIGYLAEARVFLDAFHRETGDADKLADIQMVRQYLRQAKAKPREIGVTDQHILNLLNRKD